MIQWLINILKSLQGTKERPSPQDIVPRESIIQYGDRVEINISRLNIELKETPKIYTPTVGPTKSLDPLIDTGGNGIYIEGANAEDQLIVINALIEGDIATYRAPDGRLIVHRITKIGNDKKGRYFRFKGDNNPTKDPWKIRDGDIKWLLIGIIY